MLADTGDCDGCGTSEGGGGDANGLLGSRDDRRNMPIVCGDRNPRADQKTAFFQYHEYGLTLRIGAHKAGYELDMYDGGQCATL